MFLRGKFCSSNYVSLPDCLKDSLEKNGDAQFKECKGHLKLLTSSRDITTVRLPPQKQGPLPIKQDSVKQDSVKQDAVKQESIKQDGVKHESIKQESIKQDSVKQREFPKPDLLLFCGEELDNLCSAARISDYKNTMLCLTQHLHNYEMSQECGSHLGRVLYFSERALVPDSKLDRSCALELRDICNTDKAGKIACLVSHHATSETAAEQVS